jgi:hypothetical protein
MLGSFLPSASSSPCLSRSLSSGVSASPWLAQACGSRLVQPCSLLSLSFSSPCVALCFLFLAVVVPSLFLSFFFCIASSIFSALLLCLLLRSICFYGVRLSTASTYSASLCFNTFSCVRNERAKQASERLKTKQRVERKRSDMRWSHVQFQGASKSNLQKESSERRETKEREQTNIYRPRIWSSDNGCSSASPSPS